MNTLTYENGIAIDILGNLVMLSATMVVLRLELIIIFIRLICWSNRLTMESIKCFEKQQQREGLAFLPG